MPECLLAWGRVADVKAALKIFSLSSLLERRSSARQKAVATRMDKLLVQLPLLSPVLGPAEAQWPKFDHRTSSIGEVSPLLGC